MKVMKEMFLYGKGDIVVDPTNYEEAMCNIDSKRWLEAMQQKMESMYSKQVWTLVDLPKRIVPIGYKWIYKTKIGPDGKV